MHNQKMQFKFNMLKSSLKDVPKIHKLKLVLNQWARIRSREIMPTDG